MKHDKYEDFPEDAKKLAVRVGEDMAMNLGLRLAYIATEGEPGSVTLMSNTIKGQKSSSPWTTDDVVALLPGLG